jgi:hypothetical protein
MQVSLCSSRQAAGSSGAGKVRKGLYGTTKIAFEKSQRQKSYDVVDSPVVKSDQARVWKLSSVCDVPFNLHEEQ